ncbi:MAG TPA: UDP-N-acetylmuramoyl-L-alanyl-D-glutamate--2,6-diaminopimelate ligase [Kofleriaceae bacterium]|nr:UDP-N-acetylmuramoyl-L-alanyl-D-glutamate--2,6-diaminopimelate ligase [Kofleriaceae bacterium]
MTLRDLLEGLDARVIGDANLAVRGVQNDSRAVSPGDVFVAVRGRRSDGHAFVAAAIERGAAAVVVERELHPAPAVPQVIVADGAEALGVMVGHALGDPAKAMTLVGITGTNGKTTTTYLVEAALIAAGHRPGVIGTVTYRWGGPDGTSVEAPYSTPTPQILHETFAKMRAAGCTHVVMETTSAALEMHRLAGVQLAVGAFSNLTQDHLDVHGTMEAYRDAKRLLFTRHLARGIAVVNVDDPEGPGMAAAAPGHVLRVTSVSAASADIRVIAQDSTVRGITARIATPRGEVAVEARPLIGRYNVDNIALAVGICEALGLPHEAITRGIGKLAGVPGRVERVANDAGLDIFVDYAHTPDALRNVLATLRPLTKRRLLCVFGCGGDRDPTKRPKMGAAVAALADLAFVTSDNPRTEDPRAIIDQILPGVPRPFLVEPDRRVAIRAAISEATPGDIVLIAGKGHEDYQIVGTTKHHFDDREEAAAAVAARWRRSIRELAVDAGGFLRSADATSYATRVVIDNRNLAPGDLFVAIRGDRHDGHSFVAAAVRAGAAGVLVGGTAAVTLPGSPNAIFVADTRKAFGMLAHAHRTQWSGKLVAVTGSAGKTTTKDLTHAALSAAGPTHAATGSLNNETGVPQALLGLRAHHAYGVVEMGMRGIGQIEYLTKMAEPDVAVVVNAGTAHIELLGSTDAIAMAKAEIWLGLREGGTIVRPAGDERLAKWASAHRPRAPQVTFGDAAGDGGERSTERADVRLAAYTPGEGEAPSQIVIEAFGARHELALGLVGRHAALDACAALAAAHAAGATVEQAIAGLSRARPPSMRGELEAVSGRTVIVDCYNANPASMAAALRALAERAAGKTAVAVLGDMLELGEHAAAAHREAGALAKELGLGVIALGEHAQTVAEAAGPGAEVVATPSEAATRVLARTAPGDWILLKASRGMRLERVLEVLRDRSTAKGAPR